MLLSALILPGLGQISLKRYKAGVAIITLSVFSVYQLMSIAVQQANIAVNTIMAQGGAMDITSISHAANQAASNNTLYDFYFWLIAACWLFSLIDIWRTGRKT